MPANFRDLLKSRRPLLGTLLTLPSPELAEILAAAGFDWLFIDLEHTVLGIREAQAILQAVGDRIPCLLRLPLNDEIWIKKALDTGPAGIIVPLVNSAEDARRAVQWSKYPPQGRRSIGLGRAAGYGANLQPYLDSANQETALVIQAEHIAAVDAIEEILAVDGLDAVFAGPYDLSASLGRTGQVSDPAVQSAVARIRSACQAREMPLGIFSATLEGAHRYRQEGYTLIAASTDALMLSQSARQMMAGWDDLSRYTINPPLPPKDSLMTDLDLYIDAHASDYIELLRDLCRQPSIAAQNTGMAETAEKVLHLLQQTGADAQTPAHARLPHRLWPAGRR